MEFDFEKYHGAGNDFLIADIRNHASPLSADRIAKLCNRHFGVGADGMILLEESSTHDFRMRYYNADGGEATLCGNGGRCIVAFAHRHGIIRDQACFLAADGEHRANILEVDGSVYLISLDMGDIQAASWVGDSIFLDTGSPHLVQIADHLQDLDVIEKGRALRYDPAFSPGGTNVNFIQADATGIHIRTYERGVEDETLSCGTGSTAAAIGWAIRYEAGSPVELMARGGKLRVHFRREGNIFRDVRLEGPAEFVFSGKTII